MREEERRSRIDTPPRRRNSFIEYAARNQWNWLVVGGLAALASVIGAVWSFTSGHPIVALFITFAVSLIAFGAFIAWSDRPQVKGSNLAAPRPI